MNPFALPPSGPPVSTPEPPAPPAPRRGRMVVVALLSAGLVGGGAVAVSQFASADQPELATAATDDLDAPEPAEEPADAPDEPADEPADGESTLDVFRSDGTITIDVGDGEPLEIDLGDLDADAVESLHDCIGLPEFDLGFGEWEAGEWESGALDDLFGDEFFDEFLEGLPELDVLRERLDDVGGDLDGFDVFDGGVTVAGPDGVSVIDLGENGSVTVTKDGDDVVIDTTGDATVREFGELFGDFGGVLGDVDGELDSLDLGSLFDEFDDGRLEELLEGFPQLDELPDFEPIDPEAVESCIADVLGDNG